MADTIAAIATGGGLSAVGIIRMSGPRAIEIADQVFRRQSGQRLADSDSGRLYYGALTDAEGQVIDRCLCMVSRAPASYTGEDTAELQCHGAPVVLAEGLRAVFARGARQALPGEFTKRAFLNGKMDLTQAEAVIDLIDAETAAAAHNAAGQLAGAVGRRTDAIYEKLLDMAAHFQAAVDYPDEDVEDFDVRRYGGLLRESAAVLERLLDTFDRGRLLKEGVACAIIGRPNTGKSSLLNALVGYDRAIVTELEGTTRDVIEEKIRLGDLILRLSDTAGIRPTADRVEQIGVDRALRAAGRARLVIAVLDGSEDLTAADEPVLETAEKAERALVVINKADLPQRIDEGAVTDRFGSPVRVSAKTGQGIDRLCAAIGALFADEASVLPGEILTNERQAAAVSEALAAVGQARQALDDGVTADVVLTLVEEAMDALGSITGKTLRSDITDRIFSRFCVGK